MFRRLDQEDINLCVSSFIDVFNGPPWNDDWKQEQARLYLEDIFQTPGFIGVGFQHQETLEGVILGNVKRWYSGKEFFIQEMFVLNASQGKGIGKKLMAHLEDVLEEEDVQDLALLTDKGIDAEFFYKANGFNEIERLIFMAKTTE
ncbi:GNAT family N-acetyltransferase [Marinilactibacillus kalidii]|uniref:GNAT family N-acetyltransferase n=1 Tax=Marinilactibacillus kalidii TaxID=2820274 RepID=UPI001ABEB28A|nr:GNAT family N-acetyltransferase [Marinilactibacillus kalidii]